MLEVRRSPQSADARRRAVRFHRHVDLAEAAASLDVAGNHVDVAGQARCVDAGCGRLEGAPTMRRLSGSTKRNLTSASIRSPFNLSNRGA